MPPRNVSATRRSRSPKEVSTSAERVRSRSPLPDRRNDPSPSENNADSAAVDQTPLATKGGPEDIEHELKDQAKLLRRHLGLPESTGLPAPKLRDPFAVFFIERAPYSSRRGAKCKLPGCYELIPSGTYRLALCPSMCSAWYASKTMGKTDQNSQIVSTA